MPRISTRSVTPPQNRPTRRMAAIKILKRRICDLLSKSCEWQCTCDSGKTIAPHTTSCLKVTSPTKPTRRVPTWRGLPSHTNMCDNGGLAPMGREHCRGEGVDFCLIDGGPRIVQDSAGIARIWVPRPPGPTYPLIVELRNRSVKTVKISDELLQPLSVAMSS